MLDLKFTDSGVALLKSLEGFSPRIYKDSAGKRTIGYGHLVVPGDGVAEGDVLEEVQATGLLQRDVASAVACVNGCVTSNVNQNMFNALVIFAYNVGNGALQRSGLLQKINAQDFSGAAEEFMKWDKIHTAQGAFIELPGLKNRRLAEQKLFLTPVDNGENDHGLDVNS